MTFPGCAFSVAMGFMVVVYGGGGNESTQGLPFCHELTPALSNVSVINICTVMDAQSKRRAEDYAVSSLILVCAVFSFITQSVCIYVHQHSYKLNDYAPDPCISIPCVTGDCINLGNGQFECSCTAGWHGSLCNTGFLCGDAQNTCLPFSAVCNRTRECPNNFDQEGCCDDSFSSFRCGGSPRCVLSDKVCNDQEDCIGATLDETYFCTDTCTVTASALLSTETPTTMLHSTVECITTQGSSTKVSDSSPDSTYTAYGMASTASTADAGHEEKGFFDDTKNVAVVAAGVGVVVTGGAAFGLASKFCKASPGQ